MRALLAAPLLGLAACAPQIDGGTYFCGPERLCPPGQQCDDTTYTCEKPLFVEPFRCPEVTLDAEPDDLPEDASALGVLECGATLVNSATAGCIAPGEERDHFSFVHDRECTGAAPGLAVTMRYPIALAPLTLELLDASAEVVATGVLCTRSVDFSGTDAVCIDRPDLPQGTYLLRVRIADDAADCDGDCRFNRYTLDVGYPLS